jgi:TatD DNase family protein
VLLMWIDTHCHLDAAEFAADRDAVAHSAHAAAVARVVIPAIGQANFAAVAALAHRIDGGAYALGIHPLYTRHTSEAELAALRAAVSGAMDDPLFVGIGEIGLDFFVPGLNAARQQAVFEAQLKLARDFALPVICHVRRAQDQVLKGLRRFDVRQGIAHAFNGSEQQAAGYIGQGMRLGFGGNVTFERARRIRHLAGWAPLEAVVVETDAPDIAPSWRYKQRNTPDQVPLIGRELATLRGITPESLALATTANAHAALPRLALAAG